MLDLSSSNRPHLFGLLAGLALAVALAFTAVLFTKTWVHISESQLVRVTGSSQKNVRADLVVWNGLLRTEGTTLPEAYGKFQKDQLRLFDFLKSKGFSNYAASSVNVKDITKSKGQGDEGDGDKIAERSGFQLSQTIQIVSPDVVGVPRLAADCMELLATEVVVQTASIEFIYTRAGDTKVQMMAEATEDARRRAEEIAKRGGRSVDALRSARMGVVQINPLYVTATSWEGNNDTTSLDKTITATVTAEFSLR
jgi:hypothetical protein